MINSVGQSSIMYRYLTLPRDGSGPLGMMFNSSIAHQKTPTSLIPNLQEKRLGMFLSTWPSLQERVEQGHVSPNTGAP